MAVSGEQPDPVAVPLDDHAEPVVLGLMQPVPAGRHRSARVGMQGWNFDIGMPADIGPVDGKSESE